MPAMDHASLGSLFRTSSGGTPLKARQEYYVRGEVPWLLSGEVAQGEIWAATNFITRTGLQNSSAKIFPKSTVLIAMYGATAGEVGLLRVEAATNQAICGIFPNDRFLPEYLYYLLLSKRDELVGKAAGNAQPNISQAKIRETLVPLTEKVEQSRIVAILDEAFEGIAAAKANTEKNLKNAKKWADRQLAMLLSAASATGEIGALETLVASGCTLSYGVVQPGDDVPDGLPVVRPVDLCTKVVRIEGVKRMDPALARSYRRTMLLGDDLLLCVRGTTGTVAVAEPGLAGANVTRGIVPIRFDPKIVTQSLGYYLLRSEQFQAQIRAKTYGTALRQINIGDLRQIILQYPPMKQQGSLIQQLDAAQEASNHLAAVYERKLVDLKELKTALLHQAFTGRL